MSPLSVSHAAPRLLAEWEPQSAVILTWPHIHSDWASQLNNVEPVFAQIVGHICDYQEVILVCYDAAHQQHVTRVLHQQGINLAAVRMYSIPTNDTWVRDYGPLTVSVQGKLQLVDFRFNGWGGKYSAELDDRVSRGLYAQQAFGETPVTYSSLFLEGGSLDSDGAGTLLTTERCLLGPTRNPQMRKTDYEQLFKRQFGVDRVLWLAHGELQGDDTDGHIDMLARFCDTTTIAYVHCDDQQDDHYESLARMQHELQTLRTVAGKPYSLVPLPFPAAKFHDDGRRMAASYANFLIINGAVLMPTYADPLDTLAMQQLSRCFPDRKIVGVPCLPIIEQNGSLHCLTMQLPRGVIPARQ